MAGSILSEVASVTQGVPYVEAISSVISHIVKVNEVRALSYLVYYHPGRVHSQDVRILNTRVGNHDNERE